MKYSENQNCYFRTLWKNILAFVIWLTYLKKSSEQKNIKNIEKYDSLEDVVLVYLSKIIFIKDTVVYDTFVYATHDPAPISPPISNFSIIVSKFPPIPKTTPWQALNICYITSLQVSGNEMI